MVYTFVEVNIMTITDKVFDVLKVFDVRSGRIPRGDRFCKCRHSDCFVYVATGSAVYVFEGKEYIAKAGDVIFLAENSRYSIHVDNDDYTYIYVDFLFSRNENTKIQNNIYSSVVLSDVGSLFEKLLRIEKTAEFADVIYCRSLLYLIYSKIAKSFSGEYISGKRRLDIEKSVEYMSSILHCSDVNIPELAKLCNISEVHYRRLFKCIYHVSPTSFFVTLKIKNAKEILINEDCSISDVSNRCGFKNHYYFSKVFKSITSLTPSEYRRRYASIV